MDLPAWLYIKIPPAAPRTLLPDPARTFRGLDRPSMRRAPLHLLVALLLILASPPVAPLGAGPAADLASSSAESGLSLRLLLLGEEDSAARRPLPPPLPAAPLGPDVTAPLLLLRFLHRTGPTWPWELRQRLKRHDPPLSIDLTFFLLRQMLEISRARSQQAQAEQNRLLFDSVGK